METTSVSTNKNFMKFNLFNKLKLFECSKINDIYDRNSSICEKLTIDLIKFINLNDEIKVDSQELSTGRNNFNNFFKKKIKNYKSKLVKKKEEKIFKKNLLLSSKNVEVNKGDKNSINNNPSNKCLNISIDKKYCINNSLNYSIVSNLDQKKSIQIKLNQKKIFII